MIALYLTATNLSTNISNSVVTDGQGNYRIENLIPGTCQISAERASFKKYVRQGITLSIAQAVRVEIALEVGAE